MPPTLDGVTFYSHGSKLLGTLWRADTQGRRPTVLLLHGIPGVEKNTDLAYALREAGWHCLLIHYRGCWGSEGAYTLSGIVDDIIAAIDHLSTDPGVDMDRLAVVGLSLGGWGAVSAAARDPRPRAVVSINPLVNPLARPLTAEEAAEFASMLNGITAEAVKTQWAALTPLTQTAPALAGRPVLLLTGDADTLFPPAHVQPLAEAMPFARWERVPGANHVFSAHRAALIRAVLDWLTLTFSPLLPLAPSLAVRHPVESDHPRVLAVLNEWWGGRDLSNLLPRLYFQHFNDTSFVVEEAGQLAAFLIGFVSQSAPGAAYIHFVGVHPRRRQGGLGRALYERFFALARARGAREVHAVTSPVNAVSIAYHQRMGFNVSEPIRDYDGPEGDRVTLKKVLINP